ncbi:hypothetical protein [Enterocloster lavalensis]|uniref:hypothetical protein n=1 Tax=Enterocloster lavalensis TaxID=460384 RepID=UPI002665F702|nr:hypothetical protein [Enterocloster lavalensis]
MAAKKEENTQEIMETVKEENAPEIEEAEKKELAPEKEETETIYLFEDDDKYSAPLFVGVNGRFYMVKRGVDVEVPKSVSEIIKNSMAQKKVERAAMERAKMVVTIE